MNVCMYVFMCMYVCICKKNILADIEHLEGAACGTRLASLPPRNLPRTLLLLGAFAFLFLFSYQSWRLGNRAPMCVCACVCVSSAPFSSTSSTYVCVCVCVCVRERERERERGTESEREKTVAHPSSCACVRYPSTVFQGGGMCVCVSMSF